MEEVKEFGEAAAPEKFEDSFPDEAKGLMDIYSEPPMFKCPHGHGHYFNFMHVKENCELEIVPLRYCNQ